MSEPPGLWLHGPQSTEGIERDGDRWTADRPADESRLFNLTGCPLFEYERNESVVNEYVVWDDYRTEGYMQPGTYRFEVPVAIYGPNDDLGGEPEAEFTLGFDLTVGTDQMTVDVPNISDAEANARALAAEEEYLTRRLENATCLEGWDFGGTVERRATVLDRTADTVYVEVTHPYAYGQELGRGDSVSDTGSNARYVVTAEGTRRVSGDGVSPC